MDAHCHTWDLARHDQPVLATMPEIDRSFPFDEFRPELQRAGFDGAVVVQTLPEAAESRELLVLADGDAHILGVTGWVDLTARGTAKRIADLADARGGQKLVAVRHPIQKEDAAAWVRLPEVVNGLRDVSAAGLAFELLVRPEQLSSALHLVRHVPELRFILDHGGKPVVTSEAYAGWADAIRQLAGEPNVAVKLSGALLTPPSGRGSLATLRRYADHVFRHFGASRVMFGGEWPVCLRRGTYAQVVSLAGELVSCLDPAERDSVFGGTAVEWYRLRH